MHFYLRSDTHCEARNIKRLQIFRSKTACIHMTDGKIRLFCSLAKWRLHDSNYGFVAGRIESWERLAADRSSWCRLIKSGAESTQQRRKAAAQDKRTARKATAAIKSAQPPTGPKCKTCGSVPCPNRPHEASSN